MATLKDLMNKVKNINLFNRMTGQASPTVEPIQLDEQGDIDPIETSSQALSLKQATTPLTMRDRLLGRTMEQDVQTIDDNGNAQIQTLINRRPGLLTDFAAGYRENLTTPLLSENNNMNNRNGIGYRLGEGLGTAARVLGSPLGRAALTAGLVGLTGGSGLQALAYGGMAGTINQNNRMQNALYRNELAKQGIDTSNIGGYIGDNTFRQILAAKTLQDNAAYRNAMLKSMDENRKDTLALRKDQMDYQRQQDAINNAMGWSRIANDRRGLELQEQRYKDAMNGGNLSPAEKRQITENMGTLKDIERGLQLIEENPNAYSLAKGVLPAWATNRLDPKGIATRTQIDNITAVYRKWLTGAQMSDQERKAYERFLPAPTDNYQTVKAKLEGMYRSIKDKTDILMGQVNYNYNMGGNNNLNIDNDAIEAELRNRGAL